MDLLFIQERMILAGKGQVAGSSPLIGFSIGEIGGGAIQWRPLQFFQAPKCHMILLN